MRILANAKHVRLPVRMTPTSRRGKTNSSVTGRRACRNEIMWWTTMLMGRGSPKIPTSLAPLSLIWKNVGFLSHYPPQQTLWVYVVFTPQIQQLCLRFQLQSRQPRWTISGVCLFSPRHSLVRISSLCSQVVQSLRWAYCRNYIVGVCLLVFLSTSLMRPRMGIGLMHILLPVLCIYGPEWSSLLEPHCQRAL